MKLVIKKFLAIALIAASSVACDKEDEGEELDIQFKSGAEYVSSNSVVAPGSSIKVGIEASTKKEKDPIIMFNISQAVNGGSNSTVYSERLETTEYNHDETFVMDTVSGTSYTYTFTITNRDGRNAQETLTVQVQ